VRLHIPTKSPFTPTQGRDGPFKASSRVSNFSNHQRHIPQAQETTKGVGSRPSDAGDHGHSKPVYLLPSRVRKPKASEHV